eukprot:GHVT01019570.1.p1 GENE.GHVT01019570.1~~GHVT01019570.1.p1  ORF type:complete len:147 (-),score=22.78 GHVT01019570.1:470-910(-)
MRRTVEGWFSSSSSSSHSNTLPISSSSSDESSAVRLPRCPRSARPPRGKTSARIVRRSNSASRDQARDSPDVGAAVQLPELQLLTAQCHEMLASTQERSPIEATHSQVLRTTDKQMIDDHTRSDKISHSNREQLQPTNLAHNPVSD